MKIYGGSKLKIKPTSIRLDAETIEGIDNLCDGIGCSRNDWIKDTLKDVLRVENHQNSLELGTEPEEESRTRVFDCNSGTLYENGIIIGDCADYKIDDGKVFDEYGNYLGVTRGFYQKNR